AHQRRPAEDKQAPAQPGGIDVCAGALAIRVHAQCEVLNHPRYWTPPDAPGFLPLAQADGGAVDNTKMASTVCIRKVRDLADANLPCHIFAPFFWREGGKPRRRPGQRFNALRGK